MLSRLVIAFLPRSKRHLAAAAAAKSDSVLPHRRQPNRLPRPWDSWSGLPFPSPMLESEQWKWSRSVVSDSQRPHGLQPTRLLHPWNFPGKSTGVGCHCLLQKRHLKDQQIQISESLSQYILFKQVFSYRKLFRFISWSILHLAKSCCGPPPKGKPLKYSSN